MSVADPRSTSWRSSSPRRARPGTVAKADVIARLCASHVAVRDRGRARRVRQDDAAREVGRGRSASVRVGGARRRGRRRPGVPALHRGRDPPRRADPARGVRRAVGPGGIASGRSASRASGSALAALERPLVLVLDDLHARRQPVLSRRARGAVRVRPGRLADRHREQGGPGAAARPLAGAAAWCTRSAWRTSGWTSARPACCCDAAGVELDAGELSELTERTEGWPAGLYLAALSMQAGAPSPASAAGFTGDDRFVSEYFRFELLSRLPAAEARFLKHTSVLDRMCGGLCDAVLRDDAVGGDARGARAHELLRGAARPARRVVSLPPPVRRAAAQRARAQRAGHRCRSSTAGRWPGASPTTCPRRRSRYGHAAGETDTVAGLVDGLALPLLLRRPHARPLEEWLGWFGDDELARYPGARRLRSLDPRADRAARGCRAVARSRRRGDLDDPALGWQRHDRALGRHAARAHDARRCRARARRRRSGARSAPAGRAAGVPAALASCEASRTRCSAQPIARRTTSPRRSTRGWPAARRRWCPRWRRRSSRSSRPSEEPGARRDERARAAQALVDEAGLGDYSTSALAHVATARVALHEARHGGRARGAGARPPPAAAARSRASVADRPGRARAHARPSRAGASPARPARSSPRPSACSSSARTWAPWSRMRGSCASAWRRPPARTVPGR